MNPNTKKLRDNRIAINLNQYEIDLINAHCALFGKEPATLCRNLILEQLRAKLELNKIIAFYVPSTGTIQIPPSNYLVPLMLPPKMGAQQIA